MPNCIVLLRYGKNKGNKCNRNICHYHKHSKKKKLKQSVTIIYSKPNKPIIITF